MTASSAEVNEVDVINPASAEQLTITGCVQGVGLRPAIARVAARLQLAGHVSNTPAGVVLVLEGSRSAVDAFVPALGERLPPKAVIRSVQHVEIAPTGRSGFRILSGFDRGPISTPIPLDLVTCPRCLADVTGPRDRRLGYAFASCADCGPRYSIIRALPFERAATAMQGFPFCGACHEEYAGPDDRRFHAQTIACAECGPQCWLASSEGATQSRGNPAIDAAAAALRAGQIIAVKGLGGYQLLADATNAAVIQRLRLRKHRPGKPLAVMAASLAAAHVLAKIDEPARQCLTSSQGPIVVVPARWGAFPPEVNPGLGWIGLMLPTTPLHSLLARQCPPLVATSGNCEGEPLAADEAAAECQLSGIADCFLHHDRPIVRPIDDSVVRIIAGRAVTIRAARGIAPLPLQLPSTLRNVPQILAVGGQQKGAIALFNGCQAALGPHIGDFDELKTRDRFVTHVRELCQLYGAKPELIVHDVHPDYFTTRWAGLSRRPTMSVQHHHAHVVAGMIEPGWLDRAVLGVAWDGTGYGPDGTIWGGEFLRATATDYRRVGRLRPFLLFGGEAAVREPRRVALAVLCDAIGTEAALEFLAVRGFERRVQERLLKIAARPEHALLTSSMGRLFDAVAGWLLPTDASERGSSLFEGHAAMLLESACGDVNVCDCEEWGLPTEYQMPIVEGELLELDWRPLVAALVRDFQRGLAPARLAIQFHASLADAVCRMAKLHSDLPVVLCGGVFQNRILTEKVATRMAVFRQQVGLPGVIPPNDGGLAAGQLAIALARLSSANSRG